MTWRAVLDGDDAMRARAAIDRIVAELARREIVGPTLGNGHAGQALLHGYLAAVFDDDAAADRAGAAIESALADIRRHPEPWLFSGFTGSAFVLQHLAPVVGEQEEMLAELDGLIRGWLDVARWEFPWELMFGLVGVGIYALERGSRAVVERVVEHLDAIAVRDGARVGWRAMNDIDHSLYWNLGLAHGHGGVIGWLAEVCASAAPPARARPLLEGAVAWLLAHDRPDDTPRFPPVLDRAIANEERVEGWCYGDLSNAAVLARAGSVLDRPALLATGRALAHAGARHVDRAQLDLALCHGAVGHGHLLHRLGSAYGDDELLAAARRCCLRTLDGLDQLAELTSIEVGLRGGLAGIALGLVAAATEVEPAWDRVFAIALPAGSCVHGQDRVERSQ